MTTRARSCWLALVLVVSWTAGAESRQEPLSIDPRIVLDELRRAYRTAPVADEAIVTIRNALGQSRSERVTVRIDAAGVRADEGPRRVLLELGPLRVGVEEGRLVADHAAEPGLVFVYEFAGPLTAAAIEQVLPPLPVPHVAIAGPDPEGMNAPLAYARGIEWVSAELRAASLPPVEVLRGLRPEGPVVLTIHAESGRLLQFSAEMPGAGGPVTLEVICRAVPPGDPATWIPPTDGRELVPALVDLRTGRARPELRPGQQAPDLALLGPDLGAWSLHDALASAARESPEGPAPPAVVILFRPGEAAADARAGVEALRAVVSGPGARRVVNRAAAVMDLGAFSRDRFQQLRSEWAGGADAERPIPADDLLWASSSAESLDRFASDAGAAAIIVGPDRTIRAILRLDGRGSDVPGVIEELGRVLAGQGP